MHDAVDSAAYSWKYHTLKFCMVAGIGERTLIITNVVLFASKKGRACGANIP